MNVHDRTDMFTFVTFNSCAVLIFGINQIIYDSSKHAVLYLLINMGKFQSWVQAREFLKLYLRPFLLERFEDK